MKRLLKCEFNMDTACVELKFSDGTMIAIDTIAVESEVADTMYDRSELDWLIYNKPLEYAQLVLGGDLEGYLKGTPEHRFDGLNRKTFRTSDNAHFRVVGGCWRFLACCKYICRKMLYFCFYQL